MVHSSVHIPSVLLEQLEHYTCSCLPQEACGALLGHVKGKQIHITEFIPILNTAADPYHHFEFDGPAWVRCVMREKALIGIFHSHPSSIPAPSSEDVQQLQLFGPGLTAYLITGASNSQGMLSTAAYLVTPDAVLTSSLTLKPVPLRVT